MFEREIIVTADGSHTVLLPQQNITYHSRHGALRESMHIFIQAGLQFVWAKEPGKTLHIFEMGFGTGLNAWLTLQQANQQQQQVHYYACEMYPLNKNEYEKLNYVTAEERHTFLQLHTCPWEKPAIISPCFILHKSNTSLLSIYLKELIPAGIDLVYYDAFAPNDQPELWTPQVFEQLYANMHAGAALVTYCSKGSARRSMRAAGFTVKKLPGPPGKWEMVRAVKHSK